MNAPKVIRLVEDAWNGVPYPGDDKIFTPDSYDDEDITDYFKGTTWRGHTPTNLRCHSSAFSFFTPQAFHYWLPAFMIAAIENRAEADVILEYIAWSLTHNYSAERWSLFSKSQKDAVAAYLRFQVDKGGDVRDEKKALDVLQRLS